MLILCICLAFIGRICILWCDFSDSAGDGPAARHSSGLPKMLSSVPEAELNEGILASLGHLLTSNASSLGDLVKLIMSDKSTVTLANMLAVAESEPSTAAVAVNDTTDRLPPLSSCFAGLCYLCFVSCSCRLLTFGQSYFTCDEQTIA